MESTTGGAAQIEGYLDAFNDDGSLYGWVRDHGDSDRRVTVQVFLDDALVAETVADNLRPDLLEVGIGDGRFGYALQLPADLIQASSEEGGVLTAMADGRELGRVDLLERANRLSSAHRALLRPLLLAVSKRRTSTNVDRLRNRSAPQPGALSRLFQWQSSEPTPSLTPYLDFTRYRFSVNAQFDPDVYPTDLDDFRRWYLEAYSTMRRPLRVPLSADDISKLNNPAPIAGTRFPISQLALSFILNNDATRGLLNLNDEGSYRQICYHWGAELAPHLRVEDCLVPDYYAQALAHVRSEELGHDYPACPFLEIYRQRHPDLHFLSLGEALDRATLYLYVLLKSVEQPAFARYLPSTGLKRLFSVTENHSRFDLMISSLGADLSFTLERLYELYLDQGYDLRSGKFLTFDLHGNRAESFRHARPEGPAHELQLIGPLKKTSGLGQATRLSADLLARTGREINLVDFSMDNPAPDLKVKAAEIPSRSRVNLLHLNAESIPLAYAYTPDVYTGAYNIGYFFWELNTPASAHFLALDLLDEIWVSTDYGVGIYQPHTTKPVINVGMTYEEVPDVSRDEARAYLLARTGFSEDDCIFMSTFDAFSFVQRKNPLGLIRAFRAAFPDDPRAKLLLKTHNRTSVFDPKQQKMWRAIIEAVRSDPRILLVNETLPYRDLIMMKKGADCYVSLHRSEGWGFGLLEAMVLGVPLVATNYSGNLEFCSSSTSFLVEVEEIPLQNGDYIFVRPGQVWADPKLESAVQQLRTVRNDPAERARRALAGQEAAKRRFSPDAISRRYEARLAEIFAKLDR